MVGSLRRSLGLAVVVLAGCGMAGCASTVRAPAPICSPIPAVAAHRGGTERSLENTLEAFQSAGAAGIRVWELDVRFDVNGVPVVLHDATVDRVSPLTGPVSKLDASNQGIATDDGQYVPTLREVYGLAVLYHAYVLTELKVMPTESQWRAVAEEIDATVGRWSVTLMSGERPIMLEARKRFPDVETALVHDAGYLSPEQIRRYGDSYVQSVGSITSSRAGLWHAAGITLYAWTVDDPAGWEKLSFWPVDVVITNKPIAYEEWAASRCRR